MIASIFTPLDLNLSQANALELSFIWFIFSPLFFHQKIWNNLSSFQFYTLSLLMVSFRLNKSVKTIGSSISLTIIHSSFSILVALNILGLVPYTPSLTAHLAITLRAGITLWSTLIIHVVYHKPKIRLTLQIPERRPSMISHFLSSVEGIRNVIRPLTLSFRLAANITAGHIILAIIRTSITTLVLVLFLLLILPFLGVGVGYYAFELAIAFIQAFVLTLLVFIYSNDYIVRYLNK